MKYVKKIVKSILIKIKDAKARYYLKKVASKKKNNNSIKVAFIVQSLEIWDKQCDVFELMKNTKGIDASLIVVPEFDFEKDVLCEYGNEKKYFVDKYGDVIDAVLSDGEIINLDKYKFDYVFYQRPYDRYLPKELRSNEVVKKAKICYIPYGFIGAKVFENNTHSEFFRNVYIGFMDSKEECESMNRTYKHNVKRQYQKFVDLGYPVLEKFLGMNDCSEVKEVLWTPRWSYDARVGGSHFMEYKDEILELGKIQDGLEVTIRPHPLTFPNMIKEGKMTQEDVDNYLETVKEKAVQIDSNEMVEESIKKADILITDFSSIIVMYFLTGKPMIYCKCELELNDIYKNMLRGAYIANSWDDVKKYVKEICSGNDYLKEIRQEIINTEFKNIRDSKRNIVNYIIEDYQKM